MSRATVVVGLAAFLSILAHRVEGQICPNLPVGGKGAQFICGAVSVTPDGAAGIDRAAYSEGFTADFWVINIGTGADVFDLTCQPKVPYTICRDLSSASVSLAPNESTQVTVTYGTDHPGSGQVGLKAVGETYGSSDSGSYVFTVLTPSNYAVRTTPDGGTTAARWAYSGTYADTFKVRNVGALVDTFNISCSGVGLTCLSTSVPKVTLQPGDSASVGANYRVGAVGTATLTLTATSAFSNPGDGAPSDAGSYNVPVFITAPTVSTTPYNYDHQVLSRCEASCFAATYAQSTVPYFTFDAPRNVTLVYHGDRMSPRPFIAVDVTPPATQATTPVQYWLQVKVSGAFVTFLNGEQLLHFSYVGGTVRLAGQIDAGTMATGVYPLDIIVTTQYDSIVAATDVATKLVIVNENASRIARGWTVAGLQRAYVQSDSSVIITTGDGSAVYFHQVCNPTCNGSKWASPAGEASVLALGVPGGGPGWTRLYPDSTKVVFNATGRTTQIIDRFGNSTGITYDGSSRLWKVQDPTGRQIVLTYGTYGLSSITDPMTRATTITVASDSTLRTIQDPGGGTTTFTYDGSRRLYTITNRRASLTRFGYDPLSWKVVAETLPLISVNGGGQQSPVLAFVPWQVVGTPAGSTASTPFTPLLSDSIIATVTDPEGHTSRFSVDRWGQGLVMTDPLGRRTTVVRDLTYGVPTAISYPWGAVEKFGWSGLFLVWHLAPGQDTTHLHYGNWAQVDSAWGGGLASQKMFVGTNGRIDSIRFAAQDTIKTRFLYDTHGRVTRITDPKGHQTNSHYNTSWGSLDSTSSQGNRFRHIKLDQFGRDSAVQAGQKVGLTTTATPWQRTIYDALNRPIKTIVGKDTTLMAYDSLFLTRVRDPSGQVYRFAYNALGWTERRFDPADTANRYDAYTYNRDGLVTGWTNRRGQAIAYTYDALHRALTKSGVNVTADTLSYSVDGLQIAAWDSVARDSLFLNSALVPTRAVTILNGHKFERTYALLSTGELDSIAIASDAGITFWQRKVLRNALTHETVGLRIGSTTTPTWISDADGLRGKVNWTGSPSTSLSSIYTTLHVHMTDSVADASLNALLGHGYGQDFVMRVARETNSDRTKGREFTYDSVGQLTRVQYVRYDHSISPFTGFGCSTSDDGWSCPFLAGTDSTKTYSYDRVGNRTDGAAQYTVGNRILTFGSDSFTTDNDGNVTRRYRGSASTRYYWSADGLLDSVTAGTTRLAYEYDGTGRLARRRRNGAVDRYFLWQGDALLAELDATASQRIGEYVYTSSVDRPLALITGASTPTTLRYFESDGLGNVVGVVRNTTLDQNVTYDAWGLQQQVTGTMADTNRMRWKGLLWEGDSTRLYYMRSRWFDPQTGRFVREDPIGLASGLNVYTFGRSDPIDAFDPSGTSSCPDTSRNPQGPPIVAAPPRTSGGRSADPCPEPDVGTIADGTGVCDDPIVCMLIETFLDGSVGPGGGLSPGGASLRNFVIKWSTPIAEFKQCQDTPQGGIRAPGIKMDTVSVQLGDWTFKSSGEADLQLWRAGIYTVTLMTSFLGTHGSGVDPGTYGRYVGSVSIRIPPNAELVGTVTWSRVNCADGSGIGKGVGFFTW